MTEFNCAEHPHGQIWASSFVPNEIAAQERVMVGYGMLAEAPRDRRAEQAAARRRDLNPRPSGYECFYLVACQELMFRMMLICAGLFRSSTGDHFA